MMDEIRDMVKSELCTGCGVCVSEDPKALKMTWNDAGFLVPELISKETQNAIKVCPFNTAPDEAVKDEDALAMIFLPEARKSDPLIGRYEQTYVGYDRRYRITSSSGGVGTYVFEYLLKRNIVDHLFVVKEVNGNYEYQLFDDVSAITRISKTRYYPVTLEKLFLQIEDLPGRVAISGVACFLKAVRLKQYYHPELKEKIPFLVGIICGGWKSRFFTDYLAQRAAIGGTYSKQEYRLKNLKSTASDYSFGAFDSESQFHQLKMGQVGDMWGTGLFKARACEFCTDVLTELADISLGDAWIPGYREDGAGHNIIITRSALAEKMIEDGAKEGLLEINKVSEEKVIQSQQSSFSHRRNGIKFRIQLATIKNQKIPFTRSRVIFDTSLTYKLVQVLRSNTRKYSLKYWKQFKDVEKYENKMRKHLKRLHFATKLYHKLR